MATMTKLKLILVLICVAGIQNALAAELPELLPTETEIAIAESAGPASVSTSATIYVLKRGGFEVARKGDNGFACIVTRHDKGSFEPQCFDSEGVESLLPVALERARLLERGESRTEIEKVIEQGYESGRFHAPKRGGVTYMLSTENRVFNGEKIIRYPPHVMIMAPYVTNKNIGADFSDPYLPWVLNEGKPSAYIMIVIKQDQGMPSTPHSEHNR